MHPNGDLLIDRKRLKSRLTTWRTLALVAVFGASALYFAKFSPNVTAVGGDYIAQINIDGTLEDDNARDDMLKDIAKDNNVKALIVQMDSPGGTAVAGEEIFLQLRKVAAKKPVVSVMRTLCASACYMSALGADVILAREGTLTGSIGVLVQTVELSALAEKLGIKPITVKSGKYKDSPSLGEPFTDEQRLVVESVVNDAYDHFVRLIVERRKMSDAQVRTLADGRVYTGNQAVGLKLIDGLGGKDEAHAWLVQNRKISAKLDIREIRPDAPVASLFQVLQQRTGIKFWENSTVGLDGLVSIWHPSLVQ
jgi:protease-4